MQSEDRQIQTVRFPNLRNDVEKNTPILSMFFSLILDWTPGKYHEKIFKGLPAGGGAPAIFYFHSVPNNILFLKSAELCAFGGTMIRLQFYGIDSFNRPIFICPENIKDGINEFFGSTYNLFDYGADEDEVFMGIEPSTITYFGSKFDCEPEGIPIDEDIIFVCGRYCKGAKK